MGTVTGYGKSRPSEETENEHTTDYDSHSQVILKEAEIKLRDQQECSTYMKSLNLTTTAESPLCGVGLHGEQSCYALMDGGAPLSCETDGRHELTGIVVFNTDCEESKDDAGNGAGISVFLKIHDYLDWIRAG